MAKCSKTYIKTLEKTYVEIKEKLEKNLIRLEKLFKQAKKTKNRLKLAN